MKRFAPFVLAVFCAASLCTPLPSRAASHHRLKTPVIDGIHCEGMEGAILHKHQYLALYDRGWHLRLPADIGIPQGTGCQYWLHTHTYDGLIHNESPIWKIFTLGEFFDVWGKKLNRYQAGPLHAYRGTKLKFTVNGRPFLGDPRTIELLNHREIIIKAGPPFITRPAHYRWGNIG